MDKDEIQWDDLQVALTRRPMKAGVPIGYLMAMGIGGAIAYLGSGAGSKILYVLAALPPFYLAGVIACLDDERFFDIVFCAMQYFSKANRSAAYWGGHSLDPF